MLKTFSLFCFGALAIVKVIITNPKEQSQHESTQMIPESSQPSTHCSDEPQPSPECLGCPQDQWPMTLPSQESPNWHHFPYSLPACHSTYLTASPSGWMACTCPTRWPSSPPCFGPALAVPSLPAADPNGCQAATALPVVLTVPHSLKTTAAAKHLIWVLEHGKYNPTYQLGRHSPKQFEADRGKATAEIQSRWM